MKAKSKKQLSEKITTQKFLIGILTTVLVISAILVGVRGVLAVTDSTIELKVNEAVVLYALQNPESELSMVLAKYLLVSEQGVLANLESEREQMIGVIRDKETQIRTERVCQKYADSSFRYTCSGWGRFAIPTAASATTTASEVNRLGRDAIIDYAEVELKKTVSSSFYTYLGTATSTFVDWDAILSGVHPLPDNLIDGYQFVTSTIPVDSPGEVDNYRNIINSIQDAGTLGKNVVPFVSSSAIVFFMQSEASGLCPGDCEAVTSTNRGFDGFVKYHYRYEVDL